MWKALFNRPPKASAKALVPPRLEPGAVLWAVGDVHGRNDLLQPLIAEVVADLARAEAPRRLFVGLGDYVDRGADSRGVLDTLIELGRRPGVECRFLRGNHEIFFERFLADPDVGPRWCEHGGRAALASYGVTPPAFVTDTDGWAEASQAAAQALPDAHRAFLAELEPSFTCGDYFFAHAGARPGTPLAEQDPDDLMWIRSDFTEASEPFEKVVVHGHTPSPAFYMDERRIGLDTGAYATGVLTAMRFEDDRRELLHVRSVGGRVTCERTSASA